MSAMENAYTHHHMRQVHNSGLVIGTIIGSSVVTLLAAIAIVISTPRLLLNPLNLTSELTVNQEDPQAPQLGPAAQKANEVLSDTQSSAGPLVRKAPSSLQR